MPDTPSDNIVFKFKGAIDENGLIKKVEEITGGSIKIAGTDIDFKQSATGKITQTEVLTAATGGTTAAVTGGPLGAGPPKLDATITDIVLKINPTTIDFAASTNAADVMTVLRPSFIEIADKLNSIVNFKSVKADAMADAVILALTGSVGTPILTDTGGNAAKHAVLQSKMSAIIEAYLEELKKADAYNNAGLKSDSELTAAIAIATGGAKHRQSRKSKKAGGKKRRKSQRRKQSKN